MGFPGDPLTGAAASACAEKETNKAYHIDLRRYLGFWAAKAHLAVKTPSCKCLTGNTPVGNGDNDKKSLQETGRGKQREGFGTEEYGGEGGQKRGLEIKGSSKNKAEGWMHVQSELFH